MALVAPSKEDRPLPTTEEEVKERLAEIEREVGVGRDGDRAICRENGKPFVTVAWSRAGTPIKQEGVGLLPTLSRKFAWPFWYLAFKEYRSSHRGKIYWRRRPQIIRCTRGYDTWDPVEKARGKEFTGYAVWARLVIDD